MVEIIENNMTPEQRAKLDAEVDQFISDCLDELKNMNIAPFDPYSYSSELVMADLGGDAERCTWLKSA